MGPEQRITSERMSTFPVARKSSEVKDGVPPSRGVLELSPQVARIWPLQLEPLELLRSSDSQRDAGG